MHPVTITTAHELYMFREAMLLVSKHASDMLGGADAARMRRWCQEKVDAVSGDADMHAFLAGLRRDAQRDAQGMLDNRVIVYTSSGYDYFDHFVDTDPAEVAAVMVHTETYEVYDELCRHLGTFVRKPRSDDGFIIDFRPGEGYYP